MSKIKSSSFLGSFGCYSEIKGELNNYNIIAMVGRSNSGKSTLINKIFGMNVAKTSQKPGKTMRINLFKFNNKTIIADLPGYGYASVSKTDRKQWSGMITDFLMFNKRVMCVIIVADSRRGLVEMDKEFFAWMHDHCSYQAAVAFTKIDKLKTNQVKEVLEKTKKEVPVFCSEVFAYSKEVPTSWIKISKFIETMSKNKKISYNINSDALK
ncbi:MAG: ribosome biogenesis GTP-binding protein YsxC [Chlamydiia bacterium]|nr:ribosome biogenesis GTP-binding protein YsxC [Chlamydiia bacterium]